MAQDLLELKLWFIFRVTQLQFLRKLTDLCQVLFWIFSF